MPCEKQRERDSLKWSQRRENKRKKKKNTIVWGWGGNGLHKSGKCEEI